METIEASRLEAWRALMEAHTRLTGALEHDLLSRHSLPLSWYETLVQLEAAPTGRMRMTDLAEAVLLSKSGLTRLIDKLVTAELVERFTDLDDRRSTLVALTEAGASRLVEAMPTYRAG
ncbi:MAG: MarR family winged helix-turn-helix transcriptional regulator, partial [Tepidiformaceae bacterium]